MMEEVKRKTEESFNEVVGRSSSTILRQQSGIVTLLIVRPPPPYEPALTVVAS